MPGQNLVILRDTVPVRDAGPDIAPRRDFELIRQQIGGLYVSSADFGGVAAQFLSGSNPAMQAAFAAHASRRGAEAMFATGEDIAFRLLPLLNLSGWNGLLSAVVHASHSPKWQAMARLLGTRRVGAWFTVSSLQRDALVSRAGLPPEKVVFLFDSIDTDFFNPARSQSASGQGYVFACGLENRDYATLTAAASRFKGEVRVQASGYFPQDAKTDTGLPPNLEINRSRMAWDALRNRYAGAAFVVVPLNAVPYAAGVTGLLEGMAMGKAAIVTDSPGLADYTGLDSLIRVPAGDPGRLADAMTALWRDPAACTEMGRANRQWVLGHARIEDYCATIAARMMRP